MREIIIQRLKSKTYLAAIAGIVFTWIEGSGAQLLAFMPPEIKPYWPMIFPIAMMTLRECTTAALSDK